MKSFYSDPKYPQEHEREVIGAWKGDFEPHRSHNSLAHMTPMAFLERNGHETIS